MGRPIRVAYITNKNPNLDKRLREGFSEQQIHWQEQQIGDYRVFYDLSKVIRPPSLEIYASQP